MKFVLPAYDHDFREGMQSGIVNGGTVWLWHVANALRSIGHEATLVPVGTPAPDGDVMLVQSEWMSHPCMSGFRGHVVCLLGHFVGGPYQDPRTLRADLFLSTWSGPTVDAFEKETGNTVHFWPHAYPSDSDDQTNEYLADIPWIGNPYALRDEGMLAKVPVTKLSGIAPDQLPRIYRAACVCPNIHAESQKGIVSDHPSRVNALPGYALNERFWTILGCGGILVTDIHPQHATFFDPNDLITAGTPDEFKAKVDYYSEHPQEAHKKLENARCIVRDHHTYRARVAHLVRLLKGLV